MNRQLDRYAAVINKVSGFSKQPCVNSWQKWPNKQCWYSFPPQGAIFYCEASLYPHRCGSCSQGPLENNQNMLWQTPPAARRVDTMKTNGPSTITLHLMTMLPKCSAIYDLKMFLFGSMHEKVLIQRFLNYCKASQQQSYWCVCSSSPPWPIATLHVAVLHSHPHNSGNKTALCHLLLRPLDTGCWELRKQV